MEDICIAEFEFNLEFIQYKLFCLSQQDELLFVQGILKAVVRYRI